MRIIYTRNLLLTMRIDKVKWITAHNCGKPKWHSFTLSLSWLPTLFNLSYLYMNLTDTLYIPK